MAEADSSLSYRDTDFTNVTVTSEPPVNEDDNELQEATCRLHTSLTLTADVDINLVTSTRDSDSISTGAGSSSSSLLDAKDSDFEFDTDTGEQTSGTAAVQKNESDPDGKLVRKPSTDTVKSSKGSKKSKNPFSLLKKLTKWDKPSKKTNKFSEFEQVRIDKLPQVFVAKYLGYREVSGFCGLHHVRQPVDQMVSHVQKSLEKLEEVELPLVYIVVSPRGLDVREHKLNKQKSGLPLGLIPIDFISYGVQDIKYWRVFSFIVVKEMSSRTKLTECHAYLCDSSLNARKMALSLGASFRVHSRSLKQEGKYHNFQVELRPPDQLADALADVDCDV